MSRRTRSATLHPLTRQVARQAGEFGREARTRQAHSLGRAVPATRHPDYVDVQIKTRLVRQAAAVVDRDPELVPWLAGRLRAAQDGPGRPAALPLRSALICFWLLAVTQRNFFFINLAPLVGSLSWRVRRELGIDYTDRAGRPKQISYEQLLRTFHAIAEAFDPYQEGLDEDEARSRAAELQELVNRLVRASSAEVAHSGDYAIDATLKWAYERPRTPAGRRGLNDKIDRRGKDGEAGPPLTLSAVIDADAEGDLEEAGLLPRPPRRAQDEPLRPAHLGRRSGLGGSQEQDQGCLRLRLAHRHGLEPTVSQRHRRSGGDDGQGLARTLDHAGDARPLRRPSRGGQDQAPRRRGR